MRRDILPVVTALGVVWLQHLDYASEGFFVFSCRYVGNFASLRRKVASYLPKFLFAAGDGHVRLLERHAITLQPQTGDANAVQDVPYAFS